MEFYGKTCNFAFPHPRGGCTARFGSAEGAPSEAWFYNADSCVLWGAVKATEPGGPDVSQERPFTVAGAADGRKILEAGSAERLIELAWDALTDVNTDEDGRTEQDFLIFPAGTDREDIWHWFDGRYPGGVAELMFGGGRDGREDQER